MSLTLNDEQEKALRDWWQYSKRCGNWVLGSEPDVLTLAIGPLMEPWRAGVPYCAGITLKGPNRMEVAVYPPAPDTPKKGDATHALADDICKFLNERER